MPPSISAIVVPAIRPTTAPDTPDRNSATPGLCTHRSIAS